MPSLIISVLSFFVACAAVLIGGYQAYIYRDQLSTTKDQEVRQLRAYIGVGAMQVNKVIDPNHMFFTLTFHNYGTTPAYRLNYNFSTHTESKTFNSVYSVVDQSIDRKDGTNVYPGSNQSYNGDVIISEFIDEFETDHRIITYYGTVFYSDAFNNERFTHFCLFITHDNFIAASKPDSHVYPSKCSNYDDGN